MPRYRFQWANLSPDLIHELATRLKLDGDAIEALKERYGSRPKAELVQDAWPILLDSWLSNDSNAANQIVAALKERGLGDIGINDDITYLKSCRNTSGLREIVIEAFIALGEACIDSGQKSSGSNAGTQIERLTGAELLAKVEELGDISKPELVRGAGYISFKEDGTERLEFTAYYDAIFEANGIFLPGEEPEASIGEWILNNRDDGKNISWADVPEELITTIEDVTALIDVLSEKDQVFLFNSLAPGLAFSYGLAYGLLDEAEEIIAALELLSPDELPEALLSILNCCSVEIIEAVKVKYGGIIAEYPHNTSPAGLDDFTTLNPIEDSLNDQENKVSKIIESLGIGKAKLNDDQLDLLEKYVKEAVGEYCYRGDGFWGAIDNVCTLVSNPAGDKEYTTDVFDTVVRCVRKHMVSGSLVEKITENIHISSMARLNNRDRVQAALGILNPEDLEETVGILLNWDIFEGTDPAALADALAYYYSTIVEPQNLDSMDLLFGFDDGDESLGSLEGWAELARKKGVPEFEVAKFLAEIND